MTGGISGDFEGKIAALEPSFRFLAERTRQEPTAGMMGLYTEYFVQQGLMIEAVNQTVRDIVIGWEKPYWPSAEYIAIRARQKQRAVMDEIHGIRGSEQALEDWCEAECQRRWDERLDAANAWRDAGNLDRFRLLVREIDKDIAQMLQKGLQPFMRDSKVYRTHFREGSAVGGCLRRAGEDARKLAKQQVIARQTAVHTAMREDAVEAVV